MGVLQALEAIKALAGLGDGAAGRMLCFDATAAPGRSFRAFALRPRNPTCVACGDEEVRVEKKITPETLANGEDLTAFVERRDKNAEGDENAETTCARPSKPRTPPPLRKTSSSRSRVEEDRAAYAALVGALDDAKSAAARNRDQGRGSPGGVVGFPAEDHPGEAARRADLSSERKRPRLPCGRRRLGRASARRGVVSSPSRARLLREAPAVGVRARPEPRLALGAQGGARRFDARGRFVERPERPGGGGGVNAAAAASLGARGARGGRASASALRRGVCVARSACLFASSRRASARCGRRATR